MKNGLTHLSYKFQIKYFLSRKEIKSQIENNHKYLNLDYNFDNIS